MNNLKGAFLVLLTFVFAINSCKDKDSDPDPEPIVTSVAEDKENITKTFDQMNTCVDEVKTGRLVSLVKTVFEIDKGNATDPDWMETILDSLPSAFDFDLIERDETLNIASHTGNYTYSSSNSSWVKSSNSNKQMIFKFPSTDGGDNDLTLTINDYIDESHNIDGNSVGLPKKFFLNFSQDGTTLVEINLNNVQYKELETVTIPIYVDLDIVLAPLKISVIAREVEPALFDMNMTISNDGSCDMRLFAEVKLNSSDYESLVDDDLDYIKGYLSFNDLKISTDIDANTLVNIDNPTTAQTNALIDLDVLYNNQKIGDLEFVDIEDDVKVNIVYKNGTSEDVNEAYIIPFLDDLEITLFDLVGNWE